jgi:hypothetical protein
MKILDFIIAKFFKGFNGEDEAHETVIREGFHPEKGHLEENNGGYHWVKDVPQIILKENDNAKGK